MVGPAEIDRARSGCVRFRAGLVQLGVVQGVQRVWLAFYERENYKPSKLLGHLGHLSPRPCSGAVGKSFIDKHHLPVIVFKPSIPHPMPCPLATSRRRESASRSVQPRLTEGSTIGDDASSDER